MIFDISPLWISLKTAAFATVITFFLGIVAAYWMLGYQGKWRAIVEGIFISPLILPPTVVGFLLLLLFGKNGVIGKILIPLNINIVFTWYAAIITAIVVAFPLMYKTSLGAFEQIDRKLLQVARTLGASEWLVFWRISLPLASKGIIAGIVLSFARALGEFGATLMLAGNIPGQTQTIPMAIYFAVEAGEITEAWVWVLVIMGISLSAIALVNFSQKDRSKKKVQSSVGAGLSELSLGQTKLLMNPPVQESECKIHHSSFIIHHSSFHNSVLFVDIQKQLSDFDLEVCFSSNNRPLGLLGASGAGKSMILRCIAGIETPDNGRIVLNGRVLFDSQRGINIPVRDRRIGFLFQNYALFPHLTVGQNIAFGLPKKTSKTKIKQQVEAQLAAVQLQEYYHKYPHELSGGQQQRVALARALASLPEALLLDEPFSALDTHLRSQIEQQLISTLATYKGVTLFVTHNLEEAYRVCSDLLVMEKGKAIAYNSKQEIFQYPATFRVAQLTGCKNFSCAVAKTPQQVEAVDWGCTLQVVEPIPDKLSHVGIRAHQIVFTDNCNENTFPCYLVQTSETPHRMTLFLKLHSYPNSPQDYHLQAEVFKEKWAMLKDLPFPWYVKLDSLRLILMQA